MIGRGVALRAHRWLSLTAAAFWLIQAVTGVLLVFHWELDDATITAPHRPSDFAAIEKRVTAFEAPGSGRVVSSIWTSASTSDRYDVYVDDAPGGTSRVIRIDGAGSILRDRDERQLVGDGAIFGTLVSLHQNLLAGEAGSWVTGISGILLLTNILLALGLAWPRRRAWRHALRPPRSASPAARHYGWHRALGLWAGIPAALLVATGTLMVFETGIARAIGAAPVALADPPSDLITRIGLATAIETARKRYPGSSLVAVTLPTREESFYTVRLLQAEEPPRTYGRTRVFVGADDGRVLGVYDALTSPPARRLMDQLAPFHIGKLGGTIGRIAVLALGLWLITMLTLGVRLWWLRRRAVKRA